MNNLSKAQREDMGDCYFCGSPISRGTDGKIQSKDPAPGCLCRSEYDPLLSEEDNDPV